MNNDDTFNRNQNTHPSTPTAELEARVVAWVLGEASPFEAAELERLCAEQPELAVFKRRIAAVHGLVGEAAKPMKEPLRLSPERRAKVLAAIGGAATNKPAVVGVVGARKKSRSWRSWALPLAACVTMMVLLAAVMIPTVGSVRQSSRKSAESVARMQADQLRSLESPLISQEVVDASALHNVERKGGGRGTPAPGSDVSFSDRMTVSSGLLATDATRPAAPAPSAEPVSGTFRSRDIGGVADTTVRPPRSFGVPQDQPADGFSAGLGAGGKMNEAAPKPAKRRNTITITAGTPQEFEVREFTDSEKQEIERRVAQRRLSNRLDGDVAQSAPVLGLDYKRDALAVEKLKQARALPADLQAHLEVIEELAKEMRQNESDARKAVKDEAIKREMFALDEALRAEIPSATEAVSTFSLHVSDASFRLAKAALARGEAPDPATIRPEEFYNAFDYGDPAPVAGEPVACRIEQAAHPFLQQRNLVRIAMKVPAAGRGAGTPLRLTVLLDTSGSMEREDRAATVRAAFTSLASLLGPNDRVTLIGFARTPRLLAESVAGDQAGRLIELAARTPAEGGTNMEEALALAGKLAMRQKLAGAQNRIVLLTDGAANLGDADPQQLAKRVEALRQNGIAFDACGVVADGLDDTVLEALTRKGDGRYAILNSPEEADAVFARKLAGAFRPAAKDVKVQVRFNPARVARYRLIGFEQHRLKTEDFRNDAIDAAELAAEEAAVAVYQVEVRPEGEGELGEVSVRFLDTRSSERVERSWTLAYAAQPAAFARATPSLQLAGSAAFIAEKLRGGALAGQVRMKEFAPVVEGLGAAYPNAPRVRDFIEMFRQTRRLTGE